MNINFIQKNPSLRIGEATIFGVAKGEWNLNSHEGEDGYETFVLQSEHHDGDDEAFAYREIAVCATGLLNVGDVLSIPLDCSFPAMYKVELFVEDKNISQIVIQTKPL